MRDDTLATYRPVRVLAVAVAAFGVLTCAASASAAVNTYKIRLTPEGQAAARASLLKLSDVGSGWRGGPTQVSKFSSSVCPDYHPKYSDLVVTGQAAAEFSQPGAVVRTETHVLASARMVKLDWQRSIASKNYLSCERKTQAKSSTANERVRLAQEARISAYRRQQRGVPPDHELQVEVRQDGACGVRHRPHRPRQHGDRAHDRDAAEQRRGALPERDRARQDDRRSGAGLTPSRGPLSIPVRSVRPR